MKTMYRAAKWGEIEEVKVVKEADNFVILENGIMENKTTYHFTYLDTWEEAKEWIIKEWQDEVEKHKGYLETAELRLTKAQNLKP